MEKSLPRHGPHTSHAIVGETLAELVHHDEGNAQGVVGTTEFLRETKQKAPGLWKLSPAVPGQQRGGQSQTQVLTAAYMACGMDPLNLHGREETAQLSCFGQGSPVNQPDWCWPGKEVHGDSQTTS